MATTTERVKVRIVDGTEFELVESITSVEAAGSYWHTVLVFGVYGDDAGPTMLAEARVEVRHWKPEYRTEVKLLSVTDMSDGSGYLWFEHKFPEFRKVKTGRMNAPGKGADLLSHERPMRRNVAETVENVLLKVTAEYGPWPKVKEEA